MAGLEISFPFIDVVQVDGIRTSEVWVRNRIMALGMLSRNDDELNSNGWKQYDL